MNSQEVMVALLDEGTAVWRPVPAVEQSDSSFELLAPDDYDPTDEHWEFPPGSAVFCEIRPFADGMALVAVRLREKTPNPKTQIPIKSQ